MIVSDALARRLWPGEDAIGKRVACCEGSPEDPMYKTVVGIAGGTRSRGLGEDVYPEFYLPIGQTPPDAWDWVQRTVTLVAKAKSGDPAALTGPMRSAVQEIAPGVPAYDLKTMDERLRQSLAQERFATILLAALGIAGLLLAAVGIYGIVAYFVAARTAEFGVRMALGATARDIVVATARHGIPPVAFGLAAGVGAASGRDALAAGGAARRDADGPRDVRRGRPRAGGAPPGSPCGLRPAGPRGSTRRRRSGANEDAS